MTPQHPRTVFLRNRFPLPVGLTLAFALAGCSPAPPGGLNLPPPAVTVSLPLERAVTDSNDFTGVRSPLSGRVSRRNVDPGNLVKADDTVLTSIVTQDPVYAYFDVDDLTFMQVGRQVLGGQGGPGGKRPSVLLGLAGEQGFP